MQIQILESDVANLEAVRATVHAVLPSADVHASHDFDPFPGLDAYIVGGEDEMDPQVRRRIARIRALNPRSLVCSVCISSRRADLRNLTARLKSCDPERHPPTLRATALSVWELLVSWVNPLPDHPGAPMVST